MHYFSLAATRKHQFVYSKKDEEVRSQGKSNVDIEIIFLAGIFTPLLHNNWRGSGKTNPHEHGEAHEKGEVEVSSVKFNILLEDCVVDLSHLLIFGKQ